MYLPGGCCRRIITDESLSAIKSGSILASALGAGARLVKIFDGLGVVR